MARQHKENGAQTFSITAPDATSVTLVGDFTHWQQNPVPLKRTASGVWSVSMKLPPGKHHYRFIVDGEWCDDPECMLQVPNAFGTRNSVRQVH